MAHDEVDPAETRQDEAEEEKAGDLQQSGDDTLDQIQVDKPKEGDGLEEELVDQVAELDASPPMLGIADDQIVNESSEEPVFCSQDLAGYLHTQGGLANQLAVTQ